MGGNEVLRNCDLSRHFGCAQCEWLRLGSAQVASTSLSTGGFVILFTSSFRLTIYLLLLLFKYGFIPGSKNVIMPDFPEFFGQQESALAFSVSKSDVDRVRKYILIAHQNII